MPVSAQVAHYMESSSWVRAMFEEGARLKKEHGAENVFDFSLGNPDLDPVAAVKDAFVTAAKVSTPGIHGYMPNAGYPDVRAAIAERIRNTEGVPLDEDSIVMTVGASGALNVILKTVVNPLDEVIILVPYFCEYPFYIENHGGRPIKVPTLPDFSPDLSEIEKAITGKTAAAIVTSPHNPTGKVYTENDIQGVAQLLARKGAEVGRAIALIADEPYRETVFDGIIPPSVLKAYPHSFVASSFGKSLSMPGERLGYVAMSPTMDNAALTMGGLILSNRILGFVNAPALAQRAVKTVLSAVVDASIYQRRRDRLCEALKRIGYEFVWPQGAFYLFPKSPLPDDVSFVALLKKKRILTVPGMGYGLPGHFRIAYCVPDKTIEDSLNGFEEAFNEARK